MNSHSEIKKGLSGESGKSIQSSLLREGIAADLSLTGKMNSAIGAKRTQRTTDLSYSFS
jgi:hypothetical protein